VRRLAVFNNVSLDGYFVDANGDMRWAHNTKPDAEWNAWAESNASGEGVLVFGRITYQLMASYWPTPMASKNDPVVAAGMNSMAKIVFSRTLNEAPWNNTKLVKSDPAAEIRKMKNEPGPDMAILGSGTIVSQLAQEGLIDEFQVAVIPLVLGKGRTMFDGVTKKLPLKLTKTRAFANGNVVLWYEPTA
jgi:dihydrofolate reductase